MKQSSRLPMILIAGGSVIALVVLAMLLMARAGGPEPLAQESTVVRIEPTPTPVRPEETTAPKGGSGRGAAVFGTSVRDPFMPQVTPEASDDTSTSSGDKSKSSNPTSSQKKGKTTPKASPSKPPVSGSGSGESKSTKSDEKKEQEPGSKAPQPIGGKTTDGQPTEQVEVFVLDVKDSMAVVRINGSRTTLYLNVPDPSGVIFMSALDGACAWFSKADPNERFTICEGDSRQM
jgi:hypothetical protein